MNPLSAVYGRVAKARRTWYARHPDARRALQHPVISVGNLVVGGSGKTPAVAAVATLLRDAGKRPAILTRGYGRRKGGPSIVIVSDGQRVLEAVDRSGDEPLMLARALEGVPVIVSADRYQAGRIAETRFGSTVFVLDDGFQHVQLARTVDLLLASPADLGDQPLPIGRLREPLDSAGAADALLVTGGGVGDVERLSRALGVGMAFTVKTRYEPPRLVRPFGTPYGGRSAHPAMRVLAVAGIARPERFFEALVELGWNLVRSISFRDHHWFTAHDVSRIADAARAARADIVMTTEKDAVRLEVCALDEMPDLVFLPLRVSIEPEQQFAGWVMERIA